MSENIASTVFNAAPICLIKSSNFTLLLGFRVDVDVIDDDDDDDDNDNDDDDDDDDAEVDVLLVFEERELKQRINKSKTWQSGFSTSRKAFGSSLTLVIFTAMEMMSSSSCSAVLIPYSFFATFLMAVMTRDAC